MAEKSKAPVLTKPKRLSVDANSDGLIAITIQLRKRKLVVREASYVDGIQRGMLVGDVLERQVEADDGTPEAVKNNVEMNLWVPLSSCTTGKTKSDSVPTMDEFMVMPEADVAFWIETARELNADWFAWLSKVEAITQDAIKEEAEKKD